MSDQSQGEGWWAASDGKWYPPESAAGYQAPVAPPTATPDFAPAQPAPAEPHQPAPTQFEPMPAPGAPGTAAPAESSGSGKKMGMIIAGALVGLLAVGGIAAVVLGGGDDEAPTETIAASTTTAANQEPEPDATTTTAASAEETTTTAASAAPASGGETIDDPLPLAGTAFVYEDFSGTAWSGTFTGIVEVDLDDDDDLGACYLVLGTMTADVIGSGNVTNGFDTPTIAAVANGAVIDRGFSDCDQEGAEAAGYNRIVDAEVTQGSSYAFFSEIFVEGTVPAELTAIVLGSATSDDARYYSIDRLDSIPPAPENVGAATPGDNQPLIGASFEYRTRSDTVWTGEMLGLLPVDKGRFNEDEGTCYLVMGVMTATQLDEGFATNGFDTPDLGAIAGGEFVDGGFSDCDDSEAVENGYRSVFEANVTVGTTFPFYSELFVPTDNSGELSAVVVGSATSDDAIYFSPDLITEVTPPTLAIGDRTPGALVPIAGATFTYESFSETKWEGTLTGVVLIENQSFVEATGQCYALIGELTPTEIDEGTATSGFDTPDFTVMAQGFNYGTSFGGCDRDPGEAAGYGWILDAEVTVGTNYPFVVDFFVPGASPELDAIVLGSASNDDAIYFEPLIIDGFPTP